MTDTPTFFVPNAKPEKVEDAYAILAQACPVVPPALDKRVYSISFRADGVVWDATVGKQLRGTRTVKTRGRERSVPESDPATVLAIFPGSPYYVVIDSPPFGDTRTRWANPFMAGVPDYIQVFRQP